MAPPHDERMKTMQTRRITKKDFDEIVEVIDRWWDGPINTFAHPIFFYELGEQALAIEDDGQLIGFLLGFIANEPALGSGPDKTALGSGPDKTALGSGPEEMSRTGYVHLVGIHPEYRRRGVGRRLYDSFTDVCIRAGCERLKAITTLGNEGSQRFHLALGWDACEVDDYAGPGRKRIVFTRDLGGVQPATDRGET